MQQLTTSRKPPIYRVGVFSWMKSNLFSTPTNSILTLLLVALLIWIIPPLLNWAIFSAHYSAGTREICEADIQGACWTFVRTRILQILFGLYFANETDQIWRPIVFFILIGIHIAWILHPRAPKRSIGMLSLVLVLPIISYALLNGSWLGLPESSSDSWGGFLLTIILASFGIVMALPIGILLALGRRSKMSSIRVFCVGFIELWRGTPLITVLFMASVMLPLFLPGEIEFEKIVRAMVGITLFQSAYTAEAIRGGLAAIPKGQTEAAHSLGLSYWHTMIFIVLPQALRISIPGIMNSFIELFKDTSLVSIIGLLDLLGMANAAARSQEWRGFEIEAYIFAAALFWVCCFAMSRYSQHLERKLDTNRRS